jgi:C4-dicarboxylate-binding protein DctP
VFVLYLYKIFISSSIILLFIITNIFASTTIKFSYVVNNKTPKGKAILLFKKEIERLSKGEIRVDLYPKGILFDDVAAIKAIQKNIIQMAAPSFSKFSGVINDFQLFDIPYLFLDLEQIHKAYQGKIGEHFKKEALKKNIIILDFWDNGFKNITNNIREIVLPNDMQGIKFRTMVGKVINTQFELTGAKAFVYPFSKLKSLIVEGVIDGQENTFSNIHSQKIENYQKYLTVSEHGYLGYALISSNKFWGNLSDKEKKLILNVLKKVTEYEIKLAKKENLDSFYRIKNDSDIKITKLNIVQKKVWIDFFKSYYPLFYKNISENIIREVELLN